MVIDVYVNLSKTGYIYFFKAVLKHIHEFFTKILNSGRCTKTEPQNTT